MEFGSLADALQCLSRHEIESSYRYATYKSSKDFGEGSLYRAKENSCYKSIKSYLLSHYKKEYPEDDHTSYRKGKKFIVQDTKKLDCPARCVLREICRFPSYQISEDTSPFNFKTRAEDLLVRLRNGDDIDYEHVIVVCLPDINDHTCHSVNKVAPEPIDPRLANKIRELSQGGQTNVQTVKSVLHSYVQEICNPLPNPDSYRFYPSDKVISNHIYAATHFIKKGGEQQALISLVNEWQNKGDFVFAQLKCKDPTTKNETCDTGNSVKYGDKFLLVYQSQEQRRLLGRYGKMCFLDATYKTTLYDLPLFFVAVRTNVGYQVVATFICEKETSEAISEGLQVIRENCPAWTPKYFLCDFQESEILASEKIFPDAAVLLCDVHRNRAWDRWTRTKENVLDYGKEILSWFMRLGQARDPDKFDRTLLEFRASPLWTLKVKHYMEKVWLPHKKRWSKAFRTGLVDIVAAPNNGIEAQHKVFKSKFLNRKTTCSLATMLKILIQDFFPSRMKIYNDLNITFSGRYRKYSRDIPVAIQKRPREFIRHCMQGIELANSIARSNVSETDGMFSVVTDGRTYKVTLGNDKEMPCCECDTWFKFQMPCEHILAAMNSGTDIQWSLLSPLYMESVYCTVDDPHAEGRNENKELQVEDVTMDESSAQSPEISVLEPVEEVDSNISVKAAQAKTREKIQILNNLTYNIFNKKILKEIETQVVGVVTKHEVKAEPPMLPLPKRSLIQKQRKPGKLHASYPNGEENVETVQEIWSDLLGQDVILTEDNMDIQQSDECEAANSETPQNVVRDHLDTVIAAKLVNKIWTLKADLNTPVAKPYGMVVTDTDIRSLKPGGWLTDNILDCYLNMLSTELREQVPKQNVLHLVTSLMTTIVSGIYRISPTRGFRHKLSDYDTVTGIYGRASHWTLIIVDITAGTVYFYNPTGECNDEMELILANWNEPMWCCDVCEEWLHPHCIGRDDDEKGPGRDTAFLCEPCLSHELKDWPVESLDVILHSPVKETDENEDDYFINTGDVQKNLLEAYKRCWYLVRVEGMTSALPWMKRHFDFIRQNGQLKLYGFGEALFSQQFSIPEMIHSLFLAIFMIKLNLRNRFQRKKEPKSIYSMHNTIPAMANKTAKTFLDNENGQSENYIDQVLLKEAMIVVMQEVTGKEYLSVEKELQKTEDKKMFTANKLILNYMINDRCSFLRSNRKKGK